MLTFIQITFIRLITSNNVSPVCTSWWRHQMETFSALLDICARNSPVPCDFPAQRPVTRSFDVFFDLRPNKRLSKQWWGWWFEAPSSPLSRHCNVHSRWHAPGNLCSWLASSLTAWNATTKQSIINQLIPPWTKWPPFSRRHFQMHFRECKVYILITISLKFLFLRDNNPALV